MSRSNGLAPKVCDACFKDFSPDAKPKKCSACGNAFYCSRECQKHAWKVHRIPCKRQSAAVRSLDEDERKGYRAVAKVITKWGDAWKFIFMGLAPYILDVPTKGPQVLEDHCIVMYLESRPDAFNDATAYQLHHGKIFQIDEWCDKEMPKLEFDKEGIEMFRRGSPSPEFKSESSEHTCVRFAFCHGPGFQFCRLSILPIGKGIDKSTEKEMRPMYAAMRRTGWDSVLRRVVETGMDPDRWEALEDEFDENPGCIVC
ncbi:hypothetical protein PENSPDRAFT_651942 [Peniophora sp. CONT]|nr:hypothetical protein PENSPDRAFT_651942 [Peniophora sp. CONT]